MMTIAYSSLTTSQIEQAGYLFADELFGTDPSAYWYEIDTDGSVAGRVAMDRKTVNKYPKRGSTVMLACRPEPHPTATQIQRRQELPGILASMIMEMRYEAKSG